MKKQMIIRIMITALTGCFFFAGCTAALDSADRSDPETGLQMELSEESTVAHTALPAEGELDAVSEQDPGQGADTESEALFFIATLSDELLDYMAGRSWKEDSPVSPEELRVLTVTYHNKSGDRETGMLVVHALLAEEVLDIFQDLFQAEFPIAGIRLVDDYEADDVISMEYNNTYGYCTRKILGTNRYSMHSYGMAIDINPVQNPYLTGSLIQPEQGALYLDRADIRPGMIIAGDVCHQAFLSRGWTWGGSWTQPDYQHFEKDPHEEQS